jgi:isoquinoline 1-oxidoreductase beta subunit
MWRCPACCSPSVVQCPVFGGKRQARRCERSAEARGVKKVVRESDFVAVVADSWWRANQALQELKSSNGIRQQRRRRQQ